MGCAASSAVRDMQDSTVCHVPEAFPTPRQVLPPDQRTHELYVRELNAYLTLVAKHPQAFQNKVERRLYDRLGICSWGKPEWQREPKPADDAEWVSIGM
ncbi:ACC2 [Symbiodinium sp. CCMP2456]|nr:ACC2 [Symbiodinium sp. CCMP2456]